MKKILTLLTGIVFAILLAGACSTQNTDDDSTNAEDYPEFVTIYLKAYEDGAEMKLQLSESLDGPFTDAKRHYADVGPGTKVVWMRAENSQIRSLKVVAPLVEDGPIFPGKAKTILLNKRRRIKVPDTAPDDTEEAYKIVFKDAINGTKWPVDPYLRIKDR